MTPLSRKNLSPDEAAAAARCRFLNVWTTVGILLLLAAIVYLLGIMALPVSIVLWTLVFVFCLAGLVDKLEEKGLSRVVGTTIAYVVMVVVLLVFAFLMFSPALGLSDQFAQLIKSMPSYANNFMAWANSMYDQIGHLFEDNTVKTWLNDISSTIASAVTNLFEGGATGIVSLGTSLVNGIIAIGFATVIAFWILLELPALDREMRRLVGPSHRESYELLTITVTRVVGGYIKATLLQCLAIGAGCAVLFLVTQLPSALALAGIASVLNIVPVIGQWIAVVIIGIVGLTVSPVTALIVIAGTIIIQQFVYTFVSPKLMRNSVDIHPILTLIVLVTGSALGGAMSGMSGSIVGMLLSIPAVAIMKSLFVYYFEKTTGRQLVAYDGVFFQGTPSDDADVDPMADALSPADYVKEHQLIQQERLERTGRIEPIHADGSGPLLPKIELPFVKKFRTGQLPPISPDEGAEQTPAHQKSDSQEKQ